MKKILFSLCAVLMCTLHANAQSLVVATLSHEGNISAYYGSNALIEAYDASSDGDVISLSSGTFNSVDISKAVTLRGAGCDNDSTFNRQATYISGNFTLKKSESSEDPIIVEGIYHTKSIYLAGNVKAQIIKSILNKVAPTSGTTENQMLTIINCRIKNSIKIGTNSNGIYINSMITAPSNTSASGSIQEFRNCYVYFTEGMKNCTFNNCTMSTSSVNPLDGTDIANNCLSVGNYSVFNSNPQGSHRWHITDPSKIFNSFSYKVTDTVTYELLEEAKTKYLGTDGTQIGVYGGMIPFNTTPSSPQITKFKVAEKSSIDGKLSIDITIGMPE